MKTINIKKKTSKIQKAIKRFITKIYKKIKSIDLLDGQRRGEIIFRRVFFLIAMAMLIYLFLLIAVLPSPYDVAGAASNRIVKAPLS